MTREMFYVEMAGLVKKNLDDLGITIRNHQELKVQDHYGYGGGASYVRVAYGEAKANLYYNRKDQIVRVTLS